MNSSTHIRVFVDSDVIVSSLISKSGAAYTLLNATNDLKLSISNLSNKELVVVVDRLNLEQEKLQELIDGQLNKVQLIETNEKLQELFGDYVRDVDDAHIVAGAKAAKSQFLISYNIRHFDLEKIQQDFQITVLTPGLFLQFLRSLN